MRYDHFQDMPKYLRLLVDKALSVKDKDFFISDDLVYFDVFTFGPKFLIDKFYVLDKSSVIIFDKKTHSYWYISTESSDYLTRSLNLIAAEFLEYYYMTNNGNVTGWANELLDLVLEVIFCESRFNNVVEEYFKMVELKSYSDEEIEGLVTLIEESQTHDEYIENIISLGHHFCTYTDDMEKVFIEALEFALCDNKGQGLLCDCAHNIFKFKQNYKHRKFYYVEYLTTPYY